MWQDWVISAVQWVFVFSLLPTVLHQVQKPTLSTAVLTSVGMMVVVVTYVSLEWWAASASAGILAVLWTTLAIQRYRLNK